MDDTQQLDVENTTIPSMMPSMMPSTMPSTMPTNPSVIPSNKKSLKNTNIPVAEVATNKPLYQDTLPKTWDFDAPNPWTKIVLNKGDDFPYKFFIKIKVPSLQDYQNWKQIIPNIEFLPMTGNMMIPSKDEASALAVANLMIINFSGQLSLEDILEKNLIQISITKAQSHEVVQVKFRDQIMENLYGKSLYTTKPDFGEDLAKDKMEVRQFEKEGAKNSNKVQERVDFQNEGFRDTFEHFSANTTSGDIEAFESNDYFSNI